MRLRLGPNHLVLVVVVLTVAALTWAVVDADSGA